MKTQFCFLFLCLTFFGWSQQTEYIDFKTCKAEINFDTSLRKIHGNITYEFKILKTVDSIFFDAKNMKFSKIIIENRVLEYENDNKKLWIKNKFIANKSYAIQFKYEANPKKALYFIDWNNKEGNKQIWTQGQGKYTSNWLPSIDDMNDKIEFDLSIVFDSNYEVVANGKLKDRQVNNSTTTWHYNMQKPMSSYLVALAIGKYSKKVENSKSGIPLEMYYYPHDSLKVEPTYRYTKQMFDFLEEEIGVPYPWQNYKQIPVKDFLYSGMENTGTTIFSDDYVVDSVAFIDKNYVNVNVHELAHQWFGDMVTETSGTHHWLQEGFATYYALLAEREIFGEDYYYWRLYEYAQEIRAQDKAGMSTSLLDPKSSSTTFYKKGAWVLHMLRLRVGDKAFKTAVKKYLKKYKFKNVETDNFIHEVEKASKEDLSDFVNVWLKDVLFPEDAVIKGINNDYTSSTNMLNSHLIKTAPDLFSIIDKHDSLGYRNSHVISLLKELDSTPSMAIYKDAFNSTLKTRQALAKNLSKIPSELKTDYESLLHDKSYITIETALFTLWDNFPKDREKYLNETKGIQGFNDKNIRMLWLTLALITEGFEVENKKQYFNELVNYTDSKYGFETRQNAFQYINEIQACNDVCKENLEQATKHHNWRFSKFAKAVLKAI